MAQAKAELKEKHEIELQGAKDELEKKGIQLRSESEAESKKLIIQLRSESEAESKKLIEKIRSEAESNKQWLKDQLGSKIQLRSESEAESKKLIEKIRSEAESNKQWLKDQLDVYQSRSSSSKDLPKQGAFDGMRSKDLPKQGAFDEKRGAFDEVSDPKSGKDLDLTFGEHHLPSIFAKESMNTDDMNTLDAPDTKRTKHTNNDGTLDATKAVDDAFAKPDGVSGHVLQWGKNCERDWDTFEAHLHCPEIQLVAPTMSRSTMFTLCKQFKVSASALKSHTFMEVPRKEFGHITTK
jgi:hypothetical protein